MLHCHQVNACLSNQSRESILMKRSTIALATMTAAIALTGAAEARDQIRIVGSAQFALAVVAATISTKFEGNCDAC
jgi:ABC-type phosphate transport system substrate-binding protein